MKMEIRNSSYCKRLPITKPDQHALNQQKRFRYISEAFCLYRITFYMPHSRFCSIIHSTSISVTVYRIYFPLNKS